MKINQGQIEQLYTYWNNYFGMNIKVPTDVILDSELLFENYLTDLMKIKIYDYYFIDKVCLYDDDKRIITSYQGNKEIHSQRELFRELDKYEIVITNKYGFNSYRDKIFLRKEVVENIFTSNHTHFFSKELPFPYKDNTIFFTEKFYILINNKDILDYLQFNSKLIDYLEKGHRYSDNVFLKPNITYSKYGRLYFSNCPIQNNTEYRNFVNNNIDNLHTYDLVSGEPSYFSYITKSDTIKNIIDLRYKYPEFSNMFKNYLNIFLHSLLPAKQSFDWFYKDNKEIVDKYYNIENHIDLFETYKLIEKDTNNYYNKIIKEYKDNLSVYEYGRRIVNPCSIIMDRKELLKEHNKYLQGHVQDIILNICKKNYKEKNILPIYLIFDSFSCIINNNEKLDTEYLVDENNKFILKEE